MKVAVVGASGYVGAELVALLCQHPQMSLVDLVVSESSDALGQSFSSLYPKYLGICDTSLKALTEQWLSQAAAHLDAVFLATPHETSVEWAPKFVAAGVKVFDLSGGFRLKDVHLYPQYYGFNHKQSDLLTTAQYGLAEWYQTNIANTSLVAVPGCYPTASLLALLPVLTQDLNDINSLIVINGVSGVSGAGRKASLATSFNEVSLAPYNILQHRHQPEISQQAGSPVIFNPHLAPYKRGLLCTITLKLKPSTTTEMVNQAYLDAYENKPLVRLTAQWPKVDNVATTPFADLHWQFDQNQQVLVVSCAIDNLLKGAAAQAIQCANISLGLPSHFGLIQGALYE